MKPSNIIKFTSKPLKNLKEKVPSDIQISQSTKLQEMSEFGLSLGLLKEEILLYGESAKIKLSCLDRLKYQKDGKYIVVTAISPTRFFFNFFFKFFSLVWVKVKLPQLLELVKH